MAEIRIYDATYSVDYVGYYYFIESASSREIVLSDGYDYREIYSGSFTYDVWGYPHGTVTSFTGIYDGELVFSLTGASYDAYRAAEYLEYGEAERLLEEIQAGADRVFGSNFGDELNGYRGHDRIEGGRGDDTLYGGQGQDTLHGGDGDDSLVGGEGGGEVFGGGGHDTVVFDFDRHSAKIRYQGDAVLIDHSGTTTTVREVERFSFGNADYGLAALKASSDDPAMTLRGGATADLLQGRGGADRIFGGAGNDTLRGNGGNDRVWGDAGNDTLSGGAGNDTLEGGAGRDVANYAGGIAVRVNLSIKGAQDTGMGRDVLSGIEDLIGGSNDDALSGSGGANMLTGGMGFDTLRGFGGNDLLLGGSGNDSLLGGLGNDTLNGGSGSDVLEGGDGIDTAVFDGATRAVVNLNIATAQATGHGSDRLVSIENLRGGAAGDALTGNAIANRLDGAGGNDVLRGRGGADSLIGGAGNDTLEGGMGNDVLTGGAGADVFVFAKAQQSDRIVDFAVGVDRISIAGFDYGDLSFGSVGDDATIRFDGTRIVLAGVDVANLTEADFLFA